MKEEERAALAMAYCSMCILPDRSLCKGSIERIIGFDSSRSAIHDKLVKAYGLDRNTIETAVNAAADVYALHADFAKSLDTFIDLMDELSKGGQDEE